MESFMGKEVEVLFEETMEIQGETYWIGHTREYIKTGVKTGENLENRIKKGQNHRVFKRRYSYLHNIIVEFPEKIYYLTSVVFLQT